MKRRLAICDTEEKYSQKLCNYLEESEMFPFDVCMYTNVNTLADAIVKKKVDVVLINGKLLGDLSKIVACNDKSDMRLRCKSGDGTEECIGMLIVISEGEQYQEKNIWKYRKASEIRKDILRLYSETEDATDGAGNSRGTDGYRKSKIIGVFSAGDVEVQNDAADRICKMLCTDNKVLFLDLMPFNNLESGQDNGQMSDLSDLIYYSMNVDNGKLGIKLAELVHSKDGFGYVSGMRSFMDFDSVNKEDWIGLIRGLVKIGEFDYILLNLSVCVRGLAEVLRCCDYAFFTQTDDEYNRLKMTVFKNNLMQTEYEDVVSKADTLEYGCVNDRNRGSICSREIGAKIADKIKKRMVCQ